MSDEEFREEKSCLLIMYNKETGKPEPIYAIHNDNHGYPQFLIRNDNQWIYRSAKHYITREERTRTYYTEFEKTHHRVII
jgi:hypothetical protein